MGAHRFKPFERGPRPQNNKVLSASALSAAEGLDTDDATELAKLIERFEVEKKQEKRGT